MKNWGLGILALILSLAVFISPASALEDMNNDGRINVLDLVLSQNPRIVSGDTNADSKVNIIDLATVGLAYGSQPGDANWNPQADIANTVDEIDIFDLATVGLNYNKQFPEPVIDPIFTVSPASSDLKVGENGTIDITIETVPLEAEVYAVELKIYFDPAILNAEAVTEGDFLQQGGVGTFPVIDIDNTQGIISFASTRFGTDTGASGTGTFVTIIFSGKAEGSSYLNIDDIMVSDPSPQPITDITANNGTVNAYIIQCTQDSDCGTDGFIGGPTCSNDDVYQDYRTYTCSNPGTKDSFCSHTDTPTLIEDCGEDYCDAWEDNYCKNDDVYRKRTCYDLGCSGGACFNNPFEDEELVEECQYGCDDGECLLAMTVILPEGTNLFSLPLVPEGGSITFNELDSACTVTVNGPESVCAGHNIAYWDPYTESYQCLGLDDPLYPGQGYFMKVASDCHFIVTGEEFTILDGILGYLGTGIVRAGWNNLGAPTQRVPFSTIKSSSNCNFESVVPRKYVYGVTSCVGVPDYPNGGYEQCELIGGVSRCFCEVSDFAPGFGYYVWAKDECTIG